MRRGCGGPASGTGWPKVRSQPRASKAFRSLIAGPASSGDVLDGTAAGGPSAGRGPVSGPGPHHGRGRGVGDGDGDCQGGGWVAVLFG